MRIIPTVWITASTLRGTGLRKIISISVNSILDPSRDGMGSRFITARFAEMIATTYRNEPSPEELRFAMVVMTVMVPPAASSPICPVSNAPSEARILNTMKKLNPNDRPRERKKPSLTFSTP